MDANGRQAGGLSEGSRWSKRSVDHRKREGGDRTPQGCQNHQSAGGRVAFWHPTGVPPRSLADRGYRLSPQPPATFWQSFGLLPPFPQSGFHFYSTGSSEEPFSSVQNPLFTALFYPKNDQKLFWGVGQYLSGCPC